MKGGRWTVLAALAALGCGAAPATRPVLPVPGTRAATTSSPGARRSSPTDDFTPILDAAGRIADGTADAAVWGTARTAIGRSDAAVLEGRWRDVAGTSLAGWIALAVAQHAAHLGDRDKAKRWLINANTSAPPPIHGGRDELAAAVRELEARLAAPKVAPDLIAVVLPLTGKHAALGAELRTAISQVPRLGGRWLWLDSEGREDAAVAAVERASAAGAVAILGPVGEREALLAARRAAELEVPIGLLAPVPSAAGDAGVFRLVSGPAEEARGAADHAVALGYTTAAVFAPRDDVGTTMSDAFVARARAAGVQVTRIASYDPTGGDLEPDVRALLDLDPAKNPRLRAHLARNPKDGWRTFSPDVPFALLYVPDDHRRAALVASYLPYYGVELRTSELMDPEQLRRKHRGRIPQVVQLLGSSGWNHPDLLVGGGDAVQGALMVDACMGELDPTSADLAMTYRTATGRGLSRAAAQAYDAATLLVRARAVAAASASPRAALAKALSTANLDDGACSAAVIDGDGALQRAPGLLEVDGVEIIVAP